MKIIVWMLGILVYSLSLQGACSPYKESFVVNEVNTWDNWIELYRNPSKPPPSSLQGWEVTVCSNNDIRTCTSQSFAYNYPADGSYPIIQFPNKTVSSKDSIEILVTDDSNNVVDYFNLQQGKSFPSILLAPKALLCGFTPITTPCKYFESPNSGERDYARVPDGGCTLEENTGRWNNTQGTSNTGTLPPTACQSFQYELFNRYTTGLSPAYRLQTRIAQQPFDVNVTVACSGTGEIPARKITNIYAYSGTCPANTTGLPLLWSGSADINDTVRTITLSGLNSAKAYSSIKLMLETDAGELNCSTDSFAIRPPAFSIASPASPIPAGNFILQVFANNSGGGYDGTATATTSLQAPDPDCPVASGFLKIGGATAEPLSLIFAGDTHTSDVNATDVGEIYLSIADTTWTSVDHYDDCIPDSNVTVADSEGRFGCNIENNLSLRIVPHHFDINATLSDFAGGGFTYLSDDLNMSADLDMKVTAKNGEGNTTRNYTNGCYAKVSTLTLSHSTIPDPLTNILYDLGGAEDNVTKNADIILDLNGSEFAQGVAPLLLRLNFDRDPGKPLNPFDFTVTSAAILDTDNVSNAGGITSLAGTATFVYGRVRAYDIATDEASAPNPVEFEVYSTTSGGYVNGMPQNVLRWYRNLNHDDAAQGNAIVGGFTAGAADSEIDVSSPPTNGTQIVTVSATENRTVHLDITPWLWYSPAYGYDYNADCSRHPCFRYGYTGTSAGVTGVNSGTFGGSDFEMKPAKNITNKGVKVFR